MNERVVRALFRVINANSALLRSLDELETSQWLPPAELQELQWGRLIETLTLAYSSVPYYRRTMKERGLSPSSFRSISDLDKLPILSRQDIRNHLEELVCESTPRRSLIKTATGGSTGIPTQLYHDKAFIHSFRAAAIRCSRWTGWDVGKPWARIWGSDFDVAPYERLSTKAFLTLTNRLIIPAWDLNDNTLPQYAEALGAFGPVMVEGYATPLHLFSRFLAAKKITHIRPRAVVSSAERLFQHQRDDMEHAFGCKVFDRYGTREVGAIAHECEMGGMHVQAEHLLLEFVKDGRKATEGEAGQILVTTLTNRVMPLVRYAIGDLASPREGQCKCGRGLPLVGPIEGRVQDLLVLPGGHYLPGEFFPHLLKSYDLREFQVHQTAIDELSINLVKGASFRDSHLSAIEAQIRTCIPSQVALRFHFVDAIDRTRTGKWRYSISDIRSPSFL